MRVAHGGVDPDRIWSAWTFDPVVVIALVAAGWLYARGVRKLWAGGRRRGVGVRQASAFYLALAAIAIALLSPLEALAGSLVSGHMAQHLVLLVVAPVMLVYARPLLVCGHAWPVLRAGRRWVAHAPAALSGAFVAVALHVLAMWIWHLPAPYEAAVANEMLHGLEHASFLGSALMFWALVVQPGARRRVAYPVGLFAAIVVWILSGGLGALLSFAARPLYPTLAHHGPDWGISALVDQQLAGVVMWVPAGFAYLAAIAVLFVRWMNSLDKKMTAAWRISGVLWIAVLALGSCSYGSGRTQRFAEFPPVEAAPGMERGEVIYKRDCAWCHGDEGAGTERAPDILTDPQGGASTDFMLSTGRMPLDYADEPVERRNPAYGPAEIADVVAYVETLGPSGPPVPVVDIAAGDLAEGQQLYNQDCAACHSTTGIGGALPSFESADLPSSRVPRPANVIPGLSDATPEEIVEAMETGPGPMPVFDYESSEDDSIARYVTYLQSPENPGGADIGAIGPVAEGAVGWLIGLGVMLLVCRWLGTTRADDEGES